MRPVQDSDSTRNFASGNHTISASALPVAAGEVVDGAVNLLRAEAKLALLECRLILQRAIVAIAWTLLSGFLLQVAVALLVLGPLVTLELSTLSRLLLILVPSLLAVVCTAVACRAVGRAEADDR